ncbi:hypothetical protein PV325_001317 [Microctonus aethiopoides]|nr:hypothetical protein PV325_001317 [Microctonus aethiopoides]
MHNGDDVSGGSGYIVNAITNELNKILHEWYDDMVGHYSERPENVLCAFAKTRRVSVCVSACIYRQEGELLADKEKDRNGGNVSVRGNKGNVVMKRRLGTSAAASSITLKGFCPLVIVVVGVGVRSRVRSVIAIKQRLKRALPR